MDYIESGKLSVANIKFFVLDEADRLLDTGNQVLVFSLEASIECFYSSLSRTVLPSATT